VVGTVLAATEQRQDHVLRHCVTRVTLGVMWWFSLFATLAIGDSLLLPGWLAAAAAWPMLPRQVPGTHLDNCNAILSRR
jgi:hypothetical protein